MLIRWATENDLHSWYTLATEVSQIFQYPTDMGAELESENRGKGAVSRFEMLTAVDYMSGNNMGFICFSRKENCITWFAGSERYRSKGTGERLLKTALRQLDSNNDIIVNTFPDDYQQGAAARALYKKYGFTEEKPIMHDGHPRCEMKRPASSEKRGKSFHHRYPKFIKEAQEEYCPVCNNEPAPDGQNDIEVSDEVWICGEYPGQGRLFGKMYVMPRKHTFHFEDMPEDEAALFMKEVKRVGKALRKITGAVKINYEMHSNTGAHLHIHLCPRYLDDDFPGMAIDLSRPSDPAPYESYEEYLWFIEQMRKELTQ
jgi:diadenosine tetraphosphate (Ap4A) HIT family hydrolase/GNAT superfamily N-acetyltransferase